MKRGKAERLVFRSGCRARRILIPLLLPCAPFIIVVWRALFSFACGSHVIYSNSSNVEGLGHNMFSTSSSATRRLLPARSPSNMSTWDGMDYFSPLERERLQEIIDIYSQFPLASTYDPVKDISKEHPYVFFHQRKAGGQSMRVTLVNASRTLNLSFYVACAAGVHCDTYDLPLSHPFSGGYAVYGGHLQWGIQKGFVTTTPQRSIGQARDKGQRQLEDSYDRKSLNWMQSQLLSPHQQQRRCSQITNVALPAQSSPTPISTTLTGKLKQLKKTKSKNSFNKNSFNKKFAEKRRKPRRSPKKTPMTILGGGGNSYSPVGGHPHAVAASVAKEYSRNNIHRRSFKHKNFSCLTNFREPLTRLISCIYFRYLTNPHYKGKHGCIQKLTLSELNFLIAEEVDAMGNSCLNEPFRILSGFRDEDIINSLGLKMTKRGDSISKCSGLAANLSPRSSLNDSSSTSSLDCLVQQHQHQHQQILLESLHHSSATKMYSSSFSLFPEPHLSSLAAKVLNNTLLNPLTKCISVILEFPASTELVARKFPVLQRHGAFDLARSSNVRRYDARCETPDQERLDLLRRYTALEKVLYEAVLARTKRAYSHIILKKEMR